MLKNLLAKFHMSWDTISPNFTDTTIQDSELESYIDKLKKYGLSKKVINNRHMKSLISHKPLTNSR